MPRHWQRLLVLFVPAVLSCSLMMGAATSTAAPTGTPSQSPAITEIGVITDTDTPLPVPSKTATRTPKTPTLTPTITLTYAPAEGFFELTYIVRVNENPKSAIDLDTLEVREDRSSDIQFFIAVGSAGAFDSIDFINGATGLAMGKGDIPLSKCQDSVSSFNKYGAEDIIAGYQICVLTNQSRFVLLTIISVKDVTTEESWGSTVRLHYLM